MLAMFALILAAAAGGPSAGTPQLTFSEATSVIELDVGKLKGDLVRLAWSPDGARMYLQTAERDRLGRVSKAHHYVLALNGTPPAPVGQEPEWAVAYWTWKSAQAAPGAPAFRIAVEERRQRISSTATPMGGSLARGAPEGSAAGAAMVGIGSDTTGAIAAAVQSQMAHYYTLKLKGEVVGEFVNAPAIPGLTFGWGPQGSGIIAFAATDGRLIVMDEQGRKQHVPASKSTLLPAWNAGGTRLAYFERTGKHKAVLKIVDVKHGR